MTIQTDPPGALVYMNDQEIGRTPVTRDFTWYGDYEIEIRKEDFQTLKTHQWVKAPPSLWVPLDLFAEVLPFHFKDHHDLSFKLNPRPPEETDPAALISRAEQTKGQLESSRLKKPPATKP